jgi:hypothetical protein
MPTDEAAGPAPPSCSQEVGWRAHPRKCGDPARYGLLFPGRSETIAMCEFHADLAMDYAGARIRTTWEPAPAPEADPR